jgi:phytoene dehydrogenase-like protein
MNGNRDKLFDAIIIGAGPGGSALSAILASRGMKILLIDKHNRAGGKMLTIQKRGFSYEMFPMNGVPAQGSHFERLMDELDIDGPKTIYPDPIGRFLFELPDGEVRRLVMPARGVSPFAIKRLLRLGWADFLKFLKTMGRLISMKDAELESIRSMSFLEYLERTKLSKRIASYLVVSFCEGYFQTAPDRISAAAIARAVQQTAAGSGGRYYEGGVGRVFEAFAAKAKENGATVLYRTRVEGILVEDGKAAGVSADGQQYRAPVIVSNAGIQGTVLNLVGTRYFDDDYVEFVRGLEGNLANVGFRWILDAPVLTSPMNIFAAADTVNTMEEFEAMERGEFPNKAYLYLGTTSLYPACAPPGKQLVYACMSCLPDPRIRIEPYLEAVRDLVARVAPEVLEHIEHEETFGPDTVSRMGREPAFPGVGGEDYGIALTPEHYGDRRLDGSSPLPGLYFVGCDAGGFGLGVHQAVDSAVNVSRRILREHASKQQARVPTGTASS